MILGFGKMHTKALSVPSKCPRSLFWTKLCGDHGAISEEERDNIGFWKKKGWGNFIKKKRPWGILAVGTTISWVFYRGPMSLENFTETHWFHRKNSKNLAQGQLPEDWLVRALATRHSGALFAICLPGTFSWIIPRDSRRRGFIAWSPC